MTSYTNILVFLAIILFLHIYKSEGDHELRDVIHSQCSGKRNCIVKLEEGNYTLTSKINLGSNSLESLAIVGRGYRTRIMCKYNITDEGQGEKNVLFSIHKLNEVCLRQLHFQNCHPAKVIPLKNEHNCVKNNLAKSDCPSKPYSYQSYHLKNHSHIDNREFEFENNKAQNRPNEFDPEFKHISVNATIWIKNCSKVTIDYCSFNNFSYNAIQITDVKTTNISSLLLSNSIFYSKGYQAQARGVSYEILKSYDNENTSTLNIEHSFFEDIATLRQNSEFEVNISAQNRLNDIEGHYGGAGIKVLILAAVRVNIRIKHCYFKRCTALQGGGLFLATTYNPLGYSLTIEDSAFEWNQAIFKQYLNPSGGAILVKQRAKNSSIQIRNTKFKSNCANRGGAIGIEITAKDEKSLKFKSENNTFYCNNANSGAGGAVYIENYSSIENAFIFEKSNFTYNSAENGGAIFAFHSYINLTDSNFNANRGRLGGAIALINSNLFFNGFVSIKDNVADLKGGGLYLTAFSKIYVKASSNLLVESNQAFYKGGGMFIFNNYEERKHRSWLTQTTTLREIFCFITVGRSNHTSLEFLANTVKNISSMTTTNPNPSRGSDLYVSTWGACWNIKEGLPTLIMNNATNLNKEKYENGNSVATDINKYDAIDLSNQSLCYFVTNDTEYKPNCQAKLIDTDSFPGYMTTMQNEARKKIEKLRHLKEIPHKVYVIYPGFETSIAIVSHDESTHVILTDTVIQFGTDDSPSENKVKFRFGQSTKVEAEEIVSPSSTRVHFSLITSTDEWIHGKLCITSEISLRVINYCVPIILSRCMSGLTLQDSECKPVRKYFSIHGNDNTGVRMEKNLMMVILKDGERNDTDIVSYVRCKWFQCKSATHNNSTFNILKPTGQCVQGLKGPFCTKSENNGTLAPFYSLYYMFNNKISFECPAPWPWLTMIVYFLICAVILLVIIMLKIDIFEDYTRSITFYSGILFLLTISCGISENDIFLRVITIPIVFLNLKVTHIYPLCFFNTRGLNEALFELYAPLTFAFYTFIIYLCLHYFSGTWFMMRLKLGRNDILRQFWTILILLYTNLCGSAFLIFSCPLDSNGVRRWLINGNIKCFVDEHLKIVIAAIFTLYILSIVPLSLIFISCTQMNNLLPVVWVYEQRYKTKYKHWEVLKLILRFVLALTLIIPVSNNIDYPCLIVSIVCLLLMTLNSLLQPSENKYANYYESFCLLSLAFVGILNNKLSGLFDFLAVVPYVIFIILIIVKKSSKYVDRIREKVKNNTRQE